MLQSDAFLHFGGNRVCLYYALFVLSNSLVILWQIAHFFLKQSSHQWWLWWVWIKFVFRWKGQPTRVSQTQLDFAYFATSVCLALWTWVGVPVPPLLLAVPRATSTSRSILKVQKRIRWLFSKKSFSSTTCVTNLYGGGLLSLWKFNLG